MDLAVMALILLAVVVGIAVDLWRSRGDGW